MVATVEEFEFQAETTQLLDLMIHSLYTNKEIFLRELISNASDALDRLRFEALTNPELLAGSDKYEIRLDVDEKARTLSVSDTGIGMSREELVANIGTIAKSGTRELRERIKEGQSSQMLAEVIGRFGVGFYSSFMVADRVTLITQRAGETNATMWESQGDGTYTLKPAERSGRGTTVVLHLRTTDDDNESDFTDVWTLSRIVRQYSDFVSYPIICKFEREELNTGDAGNLGREEKPAIVIEDRVLNSMKPLWARTPSEVTEAEYSEFYKHISDDWNGQLKTMHLRAEGTVEYQALLFIPSKAPQELFYHAYESGLRLYAKRVLIMKSCEELLPRYLRFIRGIVDSADLPLNISRQTLQQDRHATVIRKWLTKKVLDTLEDMKEKEYDKYLQFWEQFGRALKEGVTSDYDNKETILSLLLFQSSRDPQSLTTLQDYVERMREGQSEIYCLTGESRSIVENSPLLEAFLAKGYEVLYLVEPVDELLIESLTEYEGKRLRSIGKGAIVLGSAEERESAEKELKQKEEEASELLQLLQQALDEYVKQVRFSSRLVSSAACLVGTEMDYSPQMERLLQKGKGGGPKQRRILELNPKHQLIAKIQERFKEDKASPIVPKFGKLLYGIALLSESSELPDGAEFNRLVVELMMTTVS
ncbi:MAG TPA: molecular chaperone HtpG [Blastocatellia bacterium]|nr:molecular chaperone HtpG [Blastocatellia bacterium]